jgi:hypothetical protein
MKNTNQVKIRNKIQNKHQVIIFQISSAVSPEQKDGALIRSFLGRFILNKYILTDFLTKKKKCCLYII